MFQISALLMVSFFFLGGNADACEEHFEPAETLYRAFKQVTPKNINTVMSPVVSPRGDMMANGRSGDRSQVYIKRIQGSVTRTVHRLSHPVGIEVNGARFSRNSKVVATYENEEDRVFVWDVGTGKFLREFSPRSLNSDQWGLSPNGDTVILTGSKPHLRVVSLNLETGRTIETNDRDLASDGTRPFQVSVAFTSDKTFVLGFDRFAPRAYSFDTSRITQTKVFRDPSETSLLALRTQIDPLWNLVDYHGWVTAPGSRWIVGFGTARLTKDKMKNSNGSMRPDSETTYHVERWDLESGTFDRTLAAVPSTRYPIQEATDFNLNKPLDDHLSLSNPNNEPSRALRHPFVLGELMTMSGHEVIALGTASLGGSDYVSVFMLSPPGGLDRSSGGLSVGTIVREVAPEMGCIISIGLQGDAIVVSSRGDKSVRRWQIGFPRR